MKTDRFLTFAVVATMFAACSNENIPVDETKDAPVTVTAGVAELTTRAGYETKADDTQSVLPETFYLTMTQDTENTSSPYNYSDVLMTKDANANTYAAPTTIKLLWKGSSRTPSVSAYTIDATTFTVQTDQSTTDGVLASDLLGAVKAAENSDITITDNNIAINFRHLLCKLDVTYTWGTEFDNVTTKAVKSVMYQGFGTDVTLDREACTVTSGTTTADITAYTTTADEGVTYLSEAIFAPYVGETPKIVITTTIDGVDRVFSIGVTAPSGDFASGNRYTMNVTIGGTSVENSSVTATVANGWGESITGNMATN